MKHPDHFADLAAFHDRFRMPHQAFPTILEDALMDFRLKFLIEELEEIKEGVAEDNLTKIADGLVDLVYVAIGTAELMGLPWDVLWMAVQQANMQKVRSEGDGHGDTGRDWQFDVVKPDGWKPPDVTGILSTFMKKELKYDRRAAVLRSIDPTGLGDRGR